MGLLVVNGLWLRGSRMFKGYWQLQGASGPDSQAFNEWAWIVSSASTFEMLRLI